MQPTNPPRPSIHSTLSHIRNLADRPFRDARRQFWIEGIRHFIQAHDARLHFDTILLSPILLQSDLADMLARRLRVAGVPCVRVTPEQFRAISQTDRASGIGAIVRQPWKTLADLDITTTPGVIVAEELRNPGNLGTILRTAEAAGLAAIILVGPKCDPFHPTVVRASMGAISNLPLVRTTPTHLAAWLRTHHIPLVGLSPDAPNLWTQLPAGPHLAIAVGEERQGLSSTLRHLCQSTVRLPMTGRSDSLNVAVATGIITYELLRRRLPTSTTSE